MLPLLLAVLLPYVLSAQSYSVSGVVTDKNSGEPVEFATVVLQASEQWAVADEKGRFTIANIHSGKTVISTSCLGYVTDEMEIVISKNITNLKIKLAQDNLALEEAVVTAKENSNSATTSRTIDKTALEHVQMMNVSDISSLLPGGATQSNTLTSEKRFDIRAASGESGNSSFGTAVEVDGVRLSNNASYSDIKGVSTNNIASANVESVEVITAWSVTMSTSPRTKQLSVGKGFGLGYSKSGAPAGVLNASLEYTRSISEPMSPYTSYQRRQMSLIYSNLLSSGVFASKPLRFSLGVTGNLGGLDNSSDPDKFLETFLRQRDNSLRANFTASWLLSLPWITNLELSASTVYSDKLTRENKNYHESVTQVALHSREQGYLMSEPFKEGAANLAVMIPAGAWYNVSAIDDYSRGTSGTIVESSATGRTERPSPRPPLMQMASFKLPDINSR